MKKQLLKVLAIILVSTSAFAQQGDGGTPKTFGLKSNGTPIDKHTIQRLQTATYEAGVMLRVSGPNVIFSPPLIIDEADTAKILSAVDQGFASL